MDPIISISKLTIGVFIIIKVFATMKIINNYMDSNFFFDFRLDLNGILNWCWFNTCFQPIIVPDIMGWIILLSSRPTIPGKMQIQYLFQSPPKIKSSLNQSQSSNGAIHRISKVFAFKSSEIIFRLLSLSVEFS